MGQVPTSNELDKAPVPDGRDLSLQALLDLWLSFPPRVRRSVLRNVFQQEEHFTRRSHDEREQASKRAWAAGMVDPLRAARWLLRGISKAMDPAYDQRADGTPNADPYRVHGGGEP
jgi:hypothetical protein